MNKLGEKCSYCHSTASEIRRRPVRGGLIQYAHQCLRCGAARSTPLKASEIENIDRLRDWDDALAENFGNHINLETQAERAKERQAFFAEHDKYLATQAWRTRRRLVMARARNMCEGCGIKDATQVHHLSYEHWKEEFLWELVAVCDECHERFHESREAARAERMGIRE